MNAKTMQGLCISTLLALAAQGADLPRLYDDAKRGKHVELAFAITALASNASGENVLTLAAVDGKDRVSFQFILPLRWHKGLEPPKLKLFEGTGKFVSTGTGTEKLAAALAKALRVRAQPFEFSEAEVFVFLINNPPSTIATQAVRLQLSYSGMPKPDYASLHCLLDLPGGRLELLCADDCQPAAVVKLFTRKQSSAAPSPGS